MKIALLSDCYPPRLGGIETQVRDLGRALHAAGHEVAVFTATRGEHSGRGLRNVEVSDEQGVAVHRVTLPLPFDLPVNPLAPRLIREELRGFDVAHVHMGVISPFAVDLGDLALELDVPTAVTWHCVLGDAGIRLRRGLGTTRRWAERGAALSAVSGMAAGLVAETVGPDVPIAVLPNGIHPDPWRPPQPGEAGGEAVMVTSALRFASRKRVPALVRMLQQVYDAHPARVRARVFGDGPLLGAARRLTARNADWLALPGRVARADLAGAYAQGGIYLAPTRMEAFGIAALEARTAGLPVVAMRSSGVADFITDGVEGLLADDDASLVAATRRLVADDELRERIRAHNLATPPEQVWDTVLQRALAEYSRAGAAGAAG